MCKFELVDKHF